MKQSNKILLDENRKTKFDFSKALDVFEPHELANMYSEYLSDVDFVVEGEKNLICLEYKNSNVKGADNPEAFRRKIVGEEFWRNMTKNFLGQCFLSGHAIKIRRINLCSMSY